MIVLAGGSEADLYSFYRRALRKAWEDGRITSDERGMLSELSPCMDRDNVERIEAREFFRGRWREYSDTPPEQRLSILESAIGFDPENDLLWSERSAALYQLGRLEDAMSSADRCLSLSSGSSEAWFWKGAVHVRKGLLTEAAECFEDALEIDPDNEIAWLMLGWTERARGDLSKAKACYDRVLDLRPDHSLGYIERGLTSVKEGDLESAHSDLMRALDLEPGNSRASDLLRSMGADVPGEVSEADHAVIGAPDGTVTIGKVQDEEGDVKHPDRKIKLIIEEEVPAAAGGPGPETVVEDLSVDADERPPPPAPPEQGQRSGQGAVYKWMRCPHCSDNIPLTTVERPLVVTCSSCGAKGKLVR